MESAEVCFACITHITSFVTSVMPLRNVIAPIMNFEPRITKEKTLEADCHQNHRAGAWQLILVGAQDYLKPRFYHVAENQVKP